MLRCFLLILFTLISGPDSIADDRRDRLIGVINEELSEVTRLSKTLSHRDPKLLVRLAELNLEKARLIKEEENTKFLALSARKRGRVNKRKFFGRSRKYFRNAQKYGEVVVKKYRRYKGKGKVYYILAFNAKEFGQISKSKSYLKSAIKYSRKGSKTYIQSTLSLAEFFYNDGKFKKALNLYKIALEKKYSKWWTKDAYNMAWCQYRIKRYNDAIATLKEVLEYSSSSNFIDMTKKAEKDLALFYTSAGRNKEAVGFYQKRGGNVSSSLIKVARHLMDQEKVVRAEKVLGQALKSARSFEQKVEINLLMLTLFEKYGLVKKHLEASRRLVTLHQTRSLSDGDKKSLLFQVKRMAAILQKQVSSGTYKDVKSTLKQKGEYATEYFQLQGQLEGNINFKTALHTGETQFAIGNFSKAVGFYSQAYEGANAKGNKKIRLIALEGMLASLGKTKNKQVQDKYLKVAYERYLSNFPRGKKADTIFQKRFGLEIAKKDYKGAEEILLRYKKSFPRNILKQEAMLARIMDHYKKAGNISMFRNYVSRVKSGEFKVTKKYANTLNKVMLTLQFENVENFTSKGDKVAALRGYVEIYNDVKSSKDAKKTSAYNIGILYHELGRPNETIMWLNRALRMMSNNEIKKYEKSLFSIVTELFNRRKFDDSARFSELLLDKTCKSRSKMKAKYFRNAVVLRLANGEIRKSLKAIKKATECNISSSQIQESKIEILRAVTEKKNWSVLERLVSELSKDRRLRGKLIIPLARIRNVHLGNGRKSLAKNLENKIMGFYNDCKGGRCEIPLLALDAVAAFQIDLLKKVSKRLYTKRLSFPEAKYNKILQEKFSTLEKVTSSGVAILKIGSGKGIVKTYQILVESYQRLAKEIQDFVPPRKTDSYVKSFRSSMMQISAPLIDKSKQFLNEARGQIKKSKILSRDNHWFIKKDRLPFSFEYRYPWPGVIMDRGGRR